MGKTAILCLLLVSSSITSASQTPEEWDFKTAKIGGKVTLDCGSDVDDPVWKMSANASTLGEGEIADDERIKIEESKLIIMDIKQDDLGFYSCYDSDDELLKKFEVDISVRLRKLPKSISIDQGSDLRDELECTLTSAGQEVVFRWFTKPEGNPDDSAQKPLCVKTDGESDCNLPVSEALFDSRDKDVPATPLSERAEIVSGKNDDGVPFSILKIKDVELEDRQIYVCRAVLQEASQSEIKNCTLSKECDQVEAILRVKDPLAALWPFVGIVVEVVILCVIIFFCEKKKTPEEKEDYEDGSNSNNIASNSSLRQRK